MKHGSTLHRLLPPKPFINLPLWLVCILWLAPAAEAQIVRDVHGNVPAIRHPKDIQPAKGGSWQQIGQRHLFDFSDSINTIVVDPVMQAHWGQTQGLETEAIWDNIRGARFRARIDGMWYIGGELLERQGVASPMLGHWAAQHRIPGWGRSKLGRDSGSNTADNAYYDVSRARGWCGWSNETWFIDGGIDALHIGAGNSSAFLSMEAAPAPYIRFARESGNHRSAMWVTRWIGTDRGPLGETAESLLNRSRAIFALQSWQLNPHVLLQGVYSFVQEQESSVAMDSWEGWNAGDSYRAQRHWGGLELQLNNSLEASIPWRIYLQSALDLVPRQGQTDPVITNRSALTQLAGTKLQWNSLAIQIEYINRATPHCRDCFEEEASDGSMALAGPARALLENGGISVQSPWDESLRLDALWRISKPFSVNLHVEANEDFSWVTPQILWNIQTVWPLSVFVSYTTGEHDSALDSPRFSFWQIGVHSGLLSF